MGALNWLDVWRECTIIELAVQLGRETASSPRAERIATSRPERRDLLNRFLVSVLSIIDGDDDPGSVARRASHHEDGASVWAAGRYTIEFAEVAKRQVRYLPLNSAREAIDGS